MESYKRVSCSTAPLASKILICLLISKLIAFSTNLNEFIFLISARIPNSLSSGFIIETFASHLIDPWDIFPSDISR